MKVGDMRTFRVGICLNRDVEPGRRRAYGILRFAASHPDWELAFLPGHPANGTPPDAATPPLDGILTYALAYPRIRREHSDVRRFAVADALPHPDADAAVAVIDTDSAAVGEVAARFFLRRGFRNFAYVGPHCPRTWSRDRERALAVAVTVEGHSFRAYNEASDAGLGAWLRKLPKPCALLAAMDDRARDVLQACRREGVSVPGQVAVLGVDNDDLLCESCRPTLSSVRLDFERCGYLMAAALDRMMRGGRLPARALSYGIVDLVERASTLDVAGGARVVSLARDFIARNATAAVSLAEIAGAAGCSPRVLQRRFAEVAGHSPLAELQARRLALVCDRLLHTARPVTGIGEGCGFSSDSQLKAAFRKAFGMSLTAYRRTGGKGVR